jgi:integrase
MARPRRDGKPVRPTNKRKLTDLYVKKLRRNPPAHSFLTWDTQQKGLALSVRPSGHAAYKVIYPFHGRSRWYTLGDHNGIGLAKARKLANEVMYQVAKGNDPQADRKAQQADRKAQRLRGTFEELATRYVEEHAKKKNKSWEQADALVRRHALPKWGKLQASTITRTDVKTLMRSIKAPIVANQALAAVSAIFSWAITEEMLPPVNPCTKVPRNDTKTRERVLSEGEVPKFWSAFDSTGLIRGAALKMILITGQRPGEVAHMRHEHIKDGWWEMPGEPVPALSWPGTKNGENHRVWLPAPACDLIAQVTGGDEFKSGFVFASSRGRAVRLDGAMKPLWERLKVERATPHDLRRTHGTTVTALGFGRDAMNRVQNHKEGGIGSVYDRHGYADENKRVMEAVAAKLMALAQGTATGNVIAFAREK